MSPPSPKRYLNKTLDLDSGQWTVDSGHWTVQYPGLPLILADTQYLQVATFQHSFSSFTFDRWRQWVAKSRPVHAGVEFDFDRRQRGRTGRTDPRTLSKTDAPRRSPVVYTRGDRHVAVIASTIAATIAPCIRPISYQENAQW